MEEQIATNPNKEKPKRIGILVVHGVGEQKRFAHLEEIASQFYKALGADTGRHIQIFPGDQAMRGAETGTWEESPVRLRWKAPKSEEKDKEIEASFWEVHWADLDMPPGFVNWLRLIGWVLGMSGVRPFSHMPGTKESSALPNMMSPPPQPNKLVWIVRIKLFFVSLLFFFLVLSIDLFYFVARRFSFQAAWLAEIRSIIYNYLGDVKLYQDRFDREDDAMETLGERTRVAIQRRMVRAMVRMATEVSEKRLEGYYIFAHSLGTVVAFNGLMQHELILPRYLNESEWNRLPGTFKKTVENPDTRDSRPCRPSWLDPGDAMNREQLLSGLRGFLTMGSPLDKFATLWPAIVPTNCNPIGVTVPWINVADPQDIVAGSLDLLQACGPSPNMGPLKQPQNIKWVGQKWFFWRAHTRYWKWEEGKNRLINCVIGWLETGQFQSPKDTTDKKCAKTIYWGGMVSIGLLLWWITASLGWLLTAGVSAMLPWGELTPTVAGVASVARQSFTAWAGPLFCRYLKETGSIAMDIAVIGLVVVAVCSYCRWKQERKNKKL
jgi:hypothetical protein